MGIHLAETDGMGAADSLVRDSRAGRSAGCPEVLVEREVRRAGWGPRGRADLASPQSATLCPGIARQHGPGSERTMVETDVKIFADGADAGRDRAAR